MSVISVKQLLEAGVHFGHYTNRWDPRMKKYIFTARNGIYIIDLQKTEELINVAYKEILRIVKNGGKVLFVGTKKQAQEIVKEVATKTKQYYVDNRWLGGTLTNFKTIRKRIKFLEDVEKLIASGEIKSYPKKEVQDILRKKNKLDLNLTGIRKMENLPDALFIVDPTKELNAIQEAKKIGIPVFGICDTNANPEVLDYVIPSNDDAIRAVKLIIQVMGNAIIEGQGGTVEPIFIEETSDDVRRIDKDKRANQEGIKNYAKANLSKRDEVKEKAPKTKVEKAAKEEKPTKDAKVKAAKEDKAVKDKDVKAPKTTKAKEEKPAKEKAVKEAKPKVEKAAKETKTKEEKPAKEKTVKDSKPKAEKPAKETKAKAAKEEKPAKAKPAKETKEKAAKEEKPAKAKVEKKATTKEEKPKKEKSAPKKTAK